MSDILQVFIRLLHLHYDAEEAVAGTQSLKKDEDKNVFTCHGNPWECWVGGGVGRRAATSFEGLFRELKKECVCPSQFTG